MLSRSPPSACSISCGTSTQRSVSISSRLRSFQSFFSSKRSYDISFGVSRVRGVLMLAILAAAPVVRAEEPAIDGRKQARAVRLASGAIRLDGRLDDEAWLKASPITEFIQAEPVEGAPPTSPMEVRFLFDDAALWVGARMRSEPGTVIQAPMSRRDDGEQAEYIQIELDTYLDRRTAYMFGV